jgi:hypothetical protein
MQTMPVVNGLEVEFRDQLQVVRLDFNDREDEDVIAALAVRGHPTIVLIGRDGEIERTWFGAATAEDLRPLVEMLLASSLLDATP